MNQIKYYFQKSKSQDFKDLRLRTMAMVGAINAALVGDEKGHFREFLDSLDGISEEDINKQLDKAKEEGFAIEDK